MTLFVELGDIFCHMTFTGTWRQFLSPREIWDFVAERALSDAGAPYPTRKGTEMGIVITDQTLDLRAGTEKATLDNSMMVPLSTICANCRESIKLGDELGFIPAYCAGELLDFRVVVHYRCREMEMS